MTCPARRIVPADDILRYIVGHIAARGYSPSYRSICRALGIKSTSTLSRQLDLLIEQGRLGHPYHSQQRFEVLQDTPIPHAPLGEPLYFVQVKQ